MKMGLEGGSVVQAHTTSTILGSISSTTKWEITTNQDAGTAAGTRLTFPIILKPFKKPTPCKGV